MRVEPVTPVLLVERLVARIVAAGPGRTRVLLDGAPPAGPGRLAAALTDPLRALGRPVVTVHAADFLRPASLRLEYGRHDPDSYYDGWLDAAGLVREVLAPLGPDGSGRYLPTLWDAVADRATRAAYRDAPTGTVLLLDGDLLLGRGLPAELAVHLDVSPTVLARRLDADAAWTLDAYRRYAAEVAPRRTADVAVRYDDPEHPALILD
ncbi:uridine kinase [Actinocatenispora sera]|uniref:Uridine kinase n=1 Tax=Actinocatenispora sera TaxID=390989 RepID=A0A810LA21_9ACTN|nr:uridine kinase [Actinocatenispora sera]BCJ31141.1 uridine kinase [Actinocatenispora sera]